MHQKPYVPSSVPNSAIVPTIVVIWEQASMPASRAYRRLVSVTLPYRRTVLRRAEQRSDLGVVLAVTTFVAQGETVHCVVGKCCQHIIHVVRPSFS